MHHKGPPPFSAIGNILTSFIAHLLIWWPMVLIGLIVVPFDLMLGWDGTTGPFGNRKHTGAAPRWSGFWSAWHYLAIRNPVSNFAHDSLSLPVDADRPCDIWGFTGVTDGFPGIEGWYYIETPDNCAFEFRYVKRTIFNRCLEVRLGWKLKGELSKHGIQYPAFVFRANPLRKFG